MCIINMWEAGKPRKRSCTNARRARLNVSQIPKQYQRVNPVAAARLGYAQGYIEQPQGQQQLVNGLYIYAEVFQDNPDTLLFEI